MKLKLFSIISFLILFIVGVQAQERDKYGNINIKGLSYEDMMRIFGNVYKPGHVFKTSGDPREIREVIIKGNKITTVLFNYGSICKPNYLGNIGDLVWQGLGNGFEFGPLAAGEVLVNNGSGGFDTLHIVDDSFILTTQGAYSPDGTLKWGWLPKEGYADPNSREIARLNAPDENGDGKPDSWPERWYSAGAGKYVWPAFLGDQATAPDEEVYFVLDDYTNYTEPRYKPFSTDTSKGGLGLDMEVRVVQFNNPLAEDLVFLVYQVTNASEKDLNRVYFGMHGDPHVGGPSDYSDDRAYFIPPSGILADPYPQRARNMVYAWDDDMKGAGGRAAGYFGWKFLESPTNSSDGRDNDDDGIIDENPANSAGNFIDGVTIPLTFGIADVTKYTAVFGAPKPRYEGDEDGDWVAAKDDIGIDGIGPDSPNYPGSDYGEGDGLPSQGWFLDNNGNNKYDIGEPIADTRLLGYKWAGSEPNFGLRDISESDQIGLTSFHAAAYTNSLPNVPKNATLMWEWLSSDSIDPNQELLGTQGDNIFNFGSGPLSLKTGESQRFSMVILFGDNRDDLVLNAETSTRVLEADYRFAQPPLKPVVKAVAGDKRVKLYWDTRAEGSVDPLSTKKDFQGYKIYRSQDFTFADVYTITDGNGVPFLGQALFDPNTGKRAQWDLIDSLSGFHPVEYQGRAVKYYLGNNTGLVHEYVDSTVQNGVTYYYAVVSYDGGNIEVGKEIPPTESQSVIQRDPITSQLIFDVNTVAVTPNPIGSGYTNAQAGINGKPTLVKGNSTGDISIQIFDDLSVENRSFKIVFDDSVTYSILDSTGVSEKFVSKDTVFVNLGKQNIQSSSFEVFDSGNNLVSPSNYALNFESGKIRGSSPGSLPSNATFTAKYRYYPVQKSKMIQGEDNNPDFFGSKIYVKNDSLTIDYAETKFLNNAATNIYDTVSHYIVSVGNAATRIKWRADYEIRWGSTDTTMKVVGTDTVYVWANPSDTARSTLSPTVKKSVLPFKVWNVTTNEPATFLVKDNNDKNKDRWNWGEVIVIQPQGETGFRTSYEVLFMPTKDTLATSILPKNGDVFFIKNKKPFRAGDEYFFTTQAATFDAAAVSDNLDQIYVVPNPYVGFSGSEAPGRLANLRGERDLQFRNLPPKCTLRIYTLTGELVQTIQKDDNTSIASWNLLSNEGQRIAYGVYIYHVDIPGVGEKIGRFAVIK